MKNYLIITAIMLISFAVACERVIDSKDPVRSIPAPAPTPTNIQVHVNLESISLDWLVMDSSNVSRYRIYVADTLPVDFRLHDSSSSSTITLSNLLINHLYYFQVVAVDLGGLEGEYSAPVSATIGYASIPINNGDQFTNSRDVTITVNSSAPASQVILSEDPTFADATFIPWAPERSFTLSPGDGVKIVHAQLVFVDGSMSGELIDDSIILDTHAEIDSVFIRPSGTTFSPGQVITFGLDAGDLFADASVSFPGVTALELFDNGTSGDNIANDGIYYGQYEVPVNSNLFHEIVTGFFTDGAGNEALPVIGNELLNINTLPDPVNLALTVNVLGEFEFSWGRSSEPDFESYRLYSSATSTVDVNSTLEAIISDPLVTLHVAPSSSRFYRIFVFDQHGASAGSNVRP